MNVPCPFCAKAVEREAALASEHFLPCGCSWRSRVPAARRVQHPTMQDMTWMCEDMDGSHVPVSSGPCPTAETAEARFIERRRLAWQAPRTAPAPTAAPAGIPAWAAAAATAVSGGIAGISGQCSVHMAPDRKCRYCRAHLPVGVAFQKGDRVRWPRDPSSDATVYGTYRGDVALVRDDGMSGAGPGGTWLCPPGPLEFLS